MNINDQALKETFSANIIIINLLQNEKKITPYIFSNHNLKQLTIEIL